MPRRKITERTRLRHETANHNTPLLKLPAELRNEIWGMITPMGETQTTSKHLDFYDINEDPGQKYQVYSVFSTQPWRRNQHAPRFKVPPLIQTCRQIREDVSSLFYASNTFIVGIGRRSDSMDEIGRTAEWLRTIGDLAAKHLRHVLLVEFERLEIGVPSRTVLLSLRKRSAKALRNGELDSDSWDRLQKDMARVTSAAVFEEIEKIEEVTSGKLLRLFERFAIRNCRAREETWAFQEVDLVL